MIRVTEIAFACYAVTDMARARAFYEGELGLKPAHARMRALLYGLGAVHSERNDESVPPPQGTQQLAFLDSGNADLGCDHRFIPC